MKLVHTKNRLRFSHHGVVISDLRLTPGPTHSVFDFLAATIALFHKNAPVALLGFAAGGLLAPLRALDISIPISTCDLDLKSYELFRRYAPAWASQVRWHHTEAVRWLKNTEPRRFNLILEDLSVSHNNDIIKPAVCWEELPALIKRKLSPDGIAVFNLLPPSSRPWMTHVHSVAAHFKSARLITLHDFHNRILIAGQRVLPAVALSRQMKVVLTQIGSRQAGRMRVHTLL